MADKPKGGLGIILEIGKGKPKGPKGPLGLPAEDEESDGGSLSEAAALVRGALESGDDEDLAMALEDFVRMCSED